MSWKKQEIITAVLFSGGHVCTMIMRTGSALTTVLCKLRGDAWEGTRDFVQTPRVWRMLRSQFPNPGLLVLFPPFLPKNTLTVEAGFMGALISLLSFPEVLLPPCDRKTRLSAT